MQIQAAACTCWLLPPPSSQCQRAASPSSGASLYSRSVYQIQAAAGSASVRVRSLKCKRLFAMYSFFVQLHQRLVLRGHGLVVEHLRLCTSCRIIDATHTYANLTACWHRQAQRLASRRIDDGRRSQLAGCVANGASGEGGEPAACKLMLGQRGWLSSLRWTAQAHGAGSHDLNR